MIKERPRIATGVIIYNDKKQILMCKSHKWPGYWIIPGGAVEWGETIENCVQREVKEETNLDIINVEFLGTQESIFPKEFFKERHFIFFDYCAQARSSHITLNEELQEYCWISAEEALKLPLGASTKEIIERFIEKNVKNLQL